MKTLNDFQKKCLRCPSIRTLSYDCFFKYFFSRERRITCRWKDYHWSCIHIVNIQTDNCSNEGSVLTANLVNSFAANKVKHPTSSWVQFKTRLVQIEYPCWITRNSRVYVSNFFFCFVKPCIYYIWFQKSFLAEKFWNTGCNFWSSILEKTKPFISWSIVFKPGIFPSEVEHIFHNRQKLFRGTTKTPICYIYNEFD